MNTTIDLKKLINSLDIVDIAKRYGELQKSGANFVYKNNKSITISPSKQIFSDFGSGNITGGDVLNLIELLDDNVSSTKEAVAILKNLSEIDTYTYTQSKKTEYKALEPKKINFKRIEKNANTELKDSQKFTPVKITESDSTYIWIHQPFRKLFECSKMNNVSHKKAEYIFKKHIGYSNFFKCPTIILKDQDNKIVDSIKYRPQKPNHYENWSEPKFLYANSHNRGERFVFPFQKEFETIINRQENGKKYFIIGEGIKNALNALFYEVPYITVESVSNSINKKIITYILNLTDKGYGIVSMFDGDKAGKKAFLKFIKNFIEMGYAKNSKINLEEFKKNIISDQTILEAQSFFLETTGFKIQNFLDFNSKLDFVNYLQKEESYEQH